MPGTKTFVVERISDRGAAEPLGPVAEIEAQGVTGIRHLIAKSSVPVNFATGAKRGYNVGHKFGPLWERKYVPSLQDVPFGELPRSDCP